MLALALTHRPCRPQDGADRARVLRIVHSDCRNCWPPLARFPANSGFTQELAPSMKRWRPDGHYDSASQIKVAVMILAYHRRPEKLDLNERYEIKASDFRVVSAHFPPSTSSG